MEKIKIIKDIGLLGTWFHLSKLINLFTFFVIAKFLSPKDFGSLSLALSVLFFFTIFPQAISNTVTKFISERNSKSIYLKGLKWAILSGIALSILIYIFSDFISYVFSQQISQYIKLLAALFFITSIYEVFKGTFLGLKKVNYFVIVETILYTSNFLMVLFFFWLGYNIYSPLYSLLIATLLSLAVSSALIKHVDFNIICPEYSDGKFLSFAKKSTIIPILAQSIVFVFIYFLTNYRPPEELGYYYFLSKITIFVLSIFPLALDKVLLPYFSEYYFKKDFVKFQKLSDAYLKLAVYSLLFLSAALYFLLDGFIPIFFAEYVGAQKYLFLFVTLGAILAFGTYSSTILIAINKLRIILLNNILLLVMTIFLSYLIVPNNGIEGIGIIHSVLYSLTILAYMLFIKRKLNTTYSLSVNTKDIKNISCVFK